MEHAAAVAAEAEVRRALVIARLDEARVRETEEALARERTRLALQAEADRILQAKASDADAALARIGALVSAGAPRGTDAEMFWLDVLVEITSAEGRLPVGQLLDRAQQFIALRDEAIYKMPGNPKTSTKPAKKHRKGGKKQRRAATGPVSVNDDEVVSHDELHEVFDDEAVLAAQEESRAEAELLVAAATARLEAEQADARREAALVEQRLAVDRAELQRLRDLHTATADEAARVAHERILQMEHAAAVAAEAEVRRALVIARLDEARVRETEEALARERTRLALQAEADRILQAKASDADAALARIGALVSAGAPRGTDAEMFWLDVLVEITSAEGRLPVGQLLDRAQQFIALRDEAIEMMPGDGMRRAPKKSAKKQSRTGRKLRISAGLVGLINAHRRQALEEGRFISAAPSVQPVQDADDLKLDDVDDSLSTVASTSLSSPVVEEAPVVANDEIDWAAVIAAGRRMPLMLRNEPEPSRARSNVFEPMLPFAVQGNLHRSLRFMGPMGVYGLAPSFMNGHRTRMIPAVRQSLSSLPPTVVDADADSEPDLRDVAESSSTVSSPVDRMARRGSSLDSVVPVSVAAVPTQNTRHIDQREIQSVIGSQPTRGEDPGDLEMVELPRSNAPSADSRFVQIWNRVKQTFTPTTPRQQKIAALIAAGVSALVASALVHHFT